MMSSSQKLKKTFVLGLVTSSIALGQAVRTSFRPGIDFTKFHSYRWVMVKGGAHPDPSLDAQIRQTFDSQLAAKGLKQVNDSADLNIEYQVALNKTEVWETYEDWTDTGLLSSRLPQKRQRTIHTGTLVLDMYDPTLKELIWTGRAGKALDMKSSESDRKNSLEAVSKKLLQNFPPE